MDSVLGGFERAVAGTLDELEVGLLGRPQEFVGAVADLYDPDSAEVAVLYLHCTDELLRPFAEAARAGTTDALEQAARRMELWLHDVRRVDAEDAHSVAWGIARGVAAHLGVVPPRDPNGGKVEWDDATRAVADRSRAVLADAGATEEDVAVALAALRQLPAGLQGKTALETALERRLGKLRAEREAEEARRAEERLRREAEAARKVEETTRKEAEPKPNPKPGNRKIVVGLAAIACLVLVVALVANSTGHSTEGSTSLEPVVTAEENGGLPTDVTLEEAGGGSPSDATNEEDSESPDDASKETGIARYSWAELKDISKEIAGAESDEEGLAIAKSYGLVDSNGRLRGDTKPVTLTDGIETSVRVLGFRHDDLVDGGKAGISFEFTDVPATYVMGSSRGWESSDMRDWLNTDFLDSFPGDLRGYVKSAKKRTNNMGHVGKDETSAVTVTEDRLWLLSSTEVYGSMREASDWSMVYDSEGVQYKLYADCGVSTSNYGFCKKDGVESWWWLRSPAGRYYSDFHGVNSAGAWSLCRYDRSITGVSPGFCF